MNMGPLPGTPPPTSPGQSQSRGPAARAGQIRRKYLLPYENFPAHGSFSIFLQTLTYAVIITSYHQLHISSNTNICSHHYLLHQLLTRDLRAAASPHIIVLIGASTGIFLHTAFLVTPQHLQHGEITAQNSFTRHIASHLKS